MAFNTHFEPRFSRRGFLAAGAGAIGVGMVAMRPDLKPLLGGGGFEPDGFPEPVTRVSRNGVLESRLEVRTSNVMINGRLYNTAVYEGLYPGPAFRINAGDTLRLDVRNRLVASELYPDVTTNVHFHGMDVLPSNNHDNVLLHINGGEDWLTEIKTWPDHPPGLYWYHAHFGGTDGATGNTEEQVYQGLAGVIPIIGWVDRVPVIAQARERILAITSIGIEGNRVVGPRQVTNENRLQMVNGVVNPQIKIRPGEVQRWRVLNADWQYDMNLAIEGHGFQVIGTDGVPVRETRDAETWLMGMGSRVEFLIRGGRPGRYAVKTLALGAAYRNPIERTLATLVVEGPEMDPMPMVTGLLNADLPDLRRSPIARRREVTFTVNPPEFLIDGKTFNENRVDMVAKAGTVEEWVIKNPSPVNHPFHIHTNNFQVISINGREQPFWNHQDVVDLPAGGEVVMRWALDERFTGKMVFHCHILFHEDHGMMQVIDIVP